VTLKLSPLIHAMFANSPFEEGRKSEFLSRRGEVWRHMDPSRSGLVPPLWKVDPSYDDYIEWALDAGMFLFRRGDEFVKNTGQTFREFLAQGYQGHRATLADFKAHLATLFPEVRLKSTLEMRAIDSLQPELMLAMIGVFTGIVYDERALGEAEELASFLTLEELESARPRLLREGPKAQVFGKTGFDFAEKILSIARGGLSRRSPMGGVADETAYLRPIEKLVEERLTPAEIALKILDRGASIIEATELQFPT
jgi:glutamate--cysteine ligase